MDKDYFEDPNKSIMNSIDKLMVQLEIIQDVLPISKIDSCIKELCIIKKMHPLNFSQFITSQCIENGVLKFGEFYLDFGFSIFKINVQVQKREEETPSSIIKKKWYKF